MLYLIIIVHVGRCMTKLLYLKQGNSEVGSHVDLKKHCCNKSTS